MSINPEATRNISTSMNIDCVMVIDDDFDVRETTIWALKKMGYLVVDGGDGSKAVEIALKHEGDIKLLLTDVVLPNGNSGPKLAKTILNDRQKMKVLLMTGFAGIGDFSNDAAVGLFPTIKKPFRNSELGIMVQNLLRDDA